MNFLAPLAFGLLILIPPIIALYFLKLRRQEYTVSSTYLWQRFVRDVEANAPWQKLRRNLLLLLQILFMLALIFAITRPATEAEGIAGQMMVLILDTSASMSATDGSGGTRLAQAQSEARNLVTNLPDDARVTVIAAAGGEADLLVSASRNRRQALDAIDAAQPTSLGSDLGPALSLAEAIVAREPGAEIVLFSDGAVQLPEQAAPARLVMVGQSGDNQAVSTLSVTPTGTGDLALFVQVRNYAERAIQRRLVVEVDGAPYTAFDLELPAQGFAAVGAGQNGPVLPAGTQTVEVRLAESDADRFALDDRAAAVVRSGELVQARLVTRGNFFLQTALNLLNARPTGPNLELTMAGVTDWQTAEAETAADPTLTSIFHIFDSYVPETLPPGNLLFIAPPQSVVGLFEVQGQTANPVVRPILNEHPLLDNVNLLETQILTTSVVAVADWSRVVVEGDLSDGVNAETVPLILAGETAGRRVVVLAFDLHQSDLPLRPAFPILMANLVNYLAPDAANLVPTQVTPGEALAITVPPAVERVGLQGPVGTERLINVENNRVSLPPLLTPGLYELTFETAGLNAEALDQTRFAVNFSDPLESAIAPQATLPTSAATAQTDTTAEMPPAWQEWWRPLAVIALILLVLEWLVYHRSRLFQLRGLIARRSDA
jgi:hypothetical protein